MTGNQSPNRPPDALDTILNFLVETLSPGRVEFSGFQSSQFYKRLLERIGNIFETPYIILRRKRDAKHLDVVATFAKNDDLTEEKVKRLTKVTLESNVVRKHLNIPDVLRGDKRHHEVTPLIGNLEFDQQDLAKEEGLNAALFVPIVVGEGAKAELRGFVVFLEKDADAFREEVVQTRHKKIGTIISNLFVLGEHFNLVREQYRYLDKTIDMEKDARNAPDGRAGALCRRFIAERYSRRGQMRKAAENFSLAAQEMPRQGDRFDDEFVTENYALAAISYLREGNGDYFRETYRKFYGVASDTGLTEKARFFFNRIIKAAQNNGFHNDARKVYIDYQWARAWPQRRRPRQHRDWIDERILVPLGQRFGQRDRPSSEQAVRLFLWVVRSAAVALLTRLLRLVSWTLFHAIETLAGIGHSALWLPHTLWGACSGFGEKPGRWAAVGGGVIFLFALIYFRYPCNGCESNYFSIATEHTQSMATGCGAFLNCLHFSVTVFTTLGFGDIFPTARSAKIFVMSEVLLGYAFLGMLLTLVARRMRQ